MSKFINLASYNSLWRGYDYFKSDRVKIVKKISDSEFESRVEGTSCYNVYINIEHPRSSTCDCPFASGRRVICKHMVATFFKAFPDELNEFEEDVRKMEEEEEEEERQKDEYIEERRKEIEKYVYSLSKDELRNALISEMMDKVYDELDDYDNEWQWRY